MYCQHCGAALPETAKFCPSCGEEQSHQSQAVPAHSDQQVSNQQASNQQLVGFSDRINDPRVAEVMGKINRSGMVFTFILAVAAFIGFTVAGVAEVGGFENPTAMFIGLGIGGLLIVIAFFQGAKARTDKTWDGTIVDKTIKQPSYTERREGSRQPQYLLHVRLDDGKIKKMGTTEDYFHYHDIGDQVRHHAGLSGGYILEKYDKSRDSVIYCIACTSKNDISNELCYRCKCPLLK